MKKIIFLATLGVSALVNGLFLTSAYAAPVTSDVQVEVSVPDIVFLQTYEKITFNLEAADLTTATAANLVDNTTVGSVVAGATAVSPDLVPAASTAKTTKSYPSVVLYKTWGLGATDGQIQHGISSVTNTLTLSSGTGPTSTITMTSPVVSSPLTKTNAPGIDPGGAIDGTFDFTFDLNGVKRSGTHIGGVVQVSAEGV